MTCNGHHNWETWNTILWMEGVSEGIYKAMLAARPYNAETAENMVRMIFPNGTPDMDHPKELCAVRWEDVAEAFNAE